MSNWKSTCNKCGKKFEVLLAYGGVNCPKCGQSAIRTPGITFSSPESNFCECDDCEESESPCSFDCDRGEECQGCQESREEYEDTVFEIDKARGRI